MTTINLHCKCLTIDKKRYNRRNEISNIVYTNPLTISSSEGIIFIMMVLDTFVLLVRRRFLSCLVIHLYSYVRVH